MIKKGNYKHGYYGTPTYKSWAEMKYRCNSPSGNNHHLYYDRGITYCKRWEKFENFLSDMGERPEKTSIDRINNNGNYCKKNCRWATGKEQCRNKRTNKLFKFNGKKLTLSEWSEILGVKRSTLAQRFYCYNWSVKKTLQKGGYQIGKRQDAKKKCINK